MPRTSRHPLCLLSIALLLATCQVESPAPPEAEPLVLYLVRHAEKQVPPADTTDDPSLTEAGAARAQVLARMLGDAGVDRILSSDFKRTRETAEPLARRLGLTTEIYDAKNMPAFAERMKETTGRILVVGHSDTTPKLVELLGADPGEPIAETEYDRLYVLVRAHEQTTAVLLRFGD